MKKKLPSFLAGFLCAILLFAIPAAYAAGVWPKTIEVGSINVLVNGKEFHPTDANGNPVDVFVYNGTTYAPLRALAEAYGLTVGYDAARNLATVTAPGFQETSLSATTSITLNRQYAYIGAGETLNLSVISTPANAHPTVTWSSSHPENINVNNGVVTVVKDTGSVSTITATTENGLSASCYVMMKSNDTTVKKVDGSIYYSKFPNILSFENVSSDTPLWTHHDLDLHKFGIYEYSYTYLVNDLSKSEELARNYAYWLRQQGYTLTREEDDPVVKQHIGNDIIYELRDPSNTYTISIKGSLYETGGAVNVGIDYSSTISKEPEKPNSPTTLISEPLSRFDYGVNFLNGVKLNWLARNQTGKTINYVKVRLNFYNGVGDPAYDEMTRLPYTNITLVGPVKPDGLIAIHGIVGYIPACAKIQIGNIELEYSDKTKDSFWYGYYTTNRNHMLDS